MARRPLLRTKSTKTIGPFMEVRRLMWTKQATWARLIRNSKNHFCAINLQKTLRESWILRVSMTGLKWLRKTQKCKARSSRSPVSMHLQLKLVRPRRNQPLIKLMVRQELPPSTTLETHRLTKWPSVTLPSKTWTRRATISSRAASKNGTDDWSYQSINHPANNSFFIHFLSLLIL